MHTEPAPGPWLRLTALGASAAVLVAVVSGAAGLGTAHQMLAALALPPLVAVAVAALLEYRRLVVPAFVSLGLFGLAALLTAPALHLAAAAAALAATTVTAALTFRGEPVPNGPWRDYVTLTKPRIMTLLLLTGAGGMFVGAEGVPPLGLFVATMTGLALACGGASALNHMLDRDIDVLMGKRTEKRPVAAGRVSAPHALEFGLALMAFSFTLLAGTVNLLTATLALVGGLFYVLVYTRMLKRSTSQNIVIGGAAGAVPPLVGLRRRDRRPHADRDLAVPDRLLLDAAALLGARTADQGELRRGEGADAAGRARRAGDRAPDPDLLLRADRDLARAVPDGLDGARVRGCGDRARRRLRRARLASRPPHDPEAGRAALPLLAALPRAALRRDGGRCGDRLMELELARRNASLGWLLFALCCLLFAGTIALAALYLSLH